MMTASIWVKSDSIFCARINTQVDLLEERIYAEKLLRDFGQPYQVKSRKCSNWLECNAIGAPCCWSGLNPNYDPFRDK